MQIDLSDDERATLIAFLRRLIDEARYPFAPGLRPLRSILDKLDPPRVVELRPQRSGATRIVGCNGERR
jgi:hypothetical protein